MFWLKIITLILVLIGAVLQYVVDLKWHDKRTNKHKYSRLALLVIIMVSGIATFTFAIIDHNDFLTLQEKSTQRVEKKIDKVDTSAASRETIAHDERAELNNKITALDSKLKPFLALAKTKYPNLSDEIALNKLAQEMKTLKETTQTIKKTIRDFSVSCEMKFSGNWTDNTKVHTALGFMPNIPYVVFKHNSQDNKFINFYPSKVSRIMNEDGTVTVTYDASVKRGEWPLGNTTDDLIGYDNLTSVAAMLDKSNVNDPNIKLELYTLNIYVNGQQRMSKSKHANFQVIVPDSGNRIISMSLVDLLAPLRRE